MGEDVPLTTFTQGGLTFWGKATNLIGAVTTSVYLYLIPVVSVIGSALLLGEAVSIVTAVAIVAILMGLVLFQKGNGPGKE